MTDRELKRLSRSELLEMLLAQSRELQSVQARLDEAEAALRQRDITIKNAGSIAEAALRLNGVFDAAQSACEQYMENIRRFSQQKEAAEAEARAIIAAAEKRCEEMERAAQRRCAELMAAACAEAQTVRDGERTYESD